MLVLTFEHREEAVIGVNMRDEIRVRVLDIRGSRVRIGIDAEGYDVNRLSVYLSKLAEASREKRGQLAVA
jgi:sRNA-binding carbon storage regulator CsrA